MDWVENYGGVSDATNMLFLKPDAALVAASKPLKYEPGSVFYYSSGTTNILSKFLRTQLGEERYQYGLIEKAHVSERAEDTS